MRRLSIIFIFICANLIGQDNIMFDSLDYFLRNKIKTVYYYISGDNPPGFNYTKSEFDRERKTLDGRIFDYRDTIYKKTWFDPRDSKTYCQQFNDTIKYTFDHLGRLFMKFHVDQYAMGPSIVVTKYFYVNESSKKLKTIVRDYENMVDSIMFQYNQSLLIKKTEKQYRKSFNRKDTTRMEVTYLGSSTDTTLPYGYFKTLENRNRNLNSYKFESKVDVTTVLYEYYPDNKLKRETRMYVLNGCDNNLCKSIVEYKYDTY